MRHVLPSLLCAGILLFNPAGTARTWAQAPDAEVQLQLAEARRQFDALEYEQAVPTLDRVIALLQARPSNDETRRQITGALELRARSKFGIGDPDGARQDFATLLRTDANYSLTGQVSPRVVALFEEVQKATVTSLRVNVTPPTAVVLLDGARVPASGTVSVGLGEHTVRAMQTGFKEGSLTFTASSGETSEAALTLVRSAAVLSVVTSPADVEVVVDGVSKGRTAAGPPPADFVERAGRAGIAANQLSGVLLITDLATGAHRIQFRRACYVQAERRQEISQLDDFVLDPVKLDSAVATVSAQSSQADVTVFVDGESRGRAPVTADICEGPHTIELRSPLGRLVRRVDARAGQKIDMSGALRPAFALVSSTQTSLNADLRGAVERAFEALQSVQIVAPPADALDAALKGEKLPADWLGYDVNRRPVGVTAEVTAAMRRDLSAKLAKAFDAQGIAAVTAPIASNRSRVVLTLLAAGVAEPDVLEVNLDQQDTVANAVAQLDRNLTFSTPTIGATAIDVADVPGAVVAAVDANGPAAKAGLKTGDIIVSAGGKPVADVAALAAAVTAQTNGPLSLEIKDAGGAARKADVPVVMRPRLLGVGDQTLLVNRTLLVLRGQLAAAANADERNAIRLNLAAALTRLESWSDARAELQQVTITDGPGVGSGTVQYLLGLCAARMGNRTDAETALKAAAASTSLLTEDGPPVKELAEARLAELQRASTAR